MPTAYEFTDFESTPRSGFVQRVDRLDRQRRPALLSFFGSGHAVVAQSSPTLGVVIHPPMLAPYNSWLIVAAALSGVAALLHAAIVVGGAPWYRFFGAGESMASAAEAGRAYPAIVTLGIALVLGLWAAYALSGAGLLAALPLLKWCLAAITGVYLLRGLAIFPLLLFAREQATPFLVWSSIICIGYGVVHLVGIMQVWSQL